MANHPPRAVREAVKRADDIHAEVYPADEGNAEPKDSAQSEVDPAVEAAAGTEPAVVATPPGDGGAPPQEPGPGPQPTPPPPVETPPPPKPEETVDHWRNKFKTLEGKYRAEVPRLSSQLRESNARINHLEGTIAAMAEPRQPARNGDDINPLVTPEEVEEYGEDFVSIMRRLAQEEAGRAVKAVTPQIEQVRGQITETLAQTQVDRVYALLDENVEDWRNVNRSEPFLAWLAEEDPYTGDTRGNMLRQAFDQKDGHRVLAFFTGFQNQQRLVHPPAAAPQTEQARQPAVKLEDLAGPRSGHSVGAPSATGDEPQSWTRRQIAKFYKDVQTGVYRNDPDKQGRIERSLERALAAGLITP